MSPRKLLIAACWFVGFSVVAGALYLALGIGLTDLECSDPDGSTRAKCPSYSSQVTTPPLAQSPRPTILLSPGTPSPSTTTAPSTTTRSTTSSTTSTTPSPAQAVIEKQGTLDTSGAQQMCTGFLVRPTTAAVNNAVTNNGVTFNLREKGSNGSPELVVTGNGTFEYPELRVVTGDTFNVGHIQNNKVSVPSGKVSRSYDISNTSGASLRGVLVCTS